MLGELYSAAFNCPAFNWICSPAVTELETVVLDWMATVWGLPTCFQSSTEGGGVIQGSASEAVVTVMVAARDRYLREVTAHIKDPEEREEAFYLRRSKLVALGGEYSHSSTQKAAQIAGVRFRSISADDEYRLTGISLRKAIDECLAKGLEPFYLTVTFGTTATCAIDGFEGITTVLKEHPRIWTHVDAAYAGGALVCPEYQHHTKHFASFDSFDTNMHKWLLTNFDASCLYVRKRKDLTDTLSITPAYLRNAQSDSGLVTDYRDWQIPLGRRFRSLKIWFVLRTYGIKGLQEYIRNHIRLGEKFAEWIAARPDLFTKVAGPAFALNVLAIKPLEAPEAIESSYPNGTEHLANGITPTTSAKGNFTKANTITKEVYDKITERGEVMLTSTLLGERYVIRIVSANPQTDEEHLKRAFDILVSTAEEVRGGKRQKDLLTADVGDMHAGR